MKRKWNVSVALAIFDEDTHAALMRYFPPRTDAADNLHTFHVWWTISNSKQNFKFTSSLRNAAALKDGKPEFMGTLAVWIALWTVQRRPISWKCILYAQATAELNRTVQSQATLIEKRLKTRCTRTSIMLFQFFRPVVGEKNK